VSLLPPPAREWLRRFVNLPVYGPLGLDDPQDFVEVRLEGCGPPLDVTRNNVVAALRPFTIGVMLERAAAEALPRDGMRLSMRQRGSEIKLGALKLRLASVIPLADRRFCLFETPACENRCVPAANLQVYDQRQKWRTRQRQRKNPHNFQMTLSDIRCSWVFYLCPRPVVLVSVEHEGASNLFPMDLIGPTDSPYFSMALRSTSPAVRLMQLSRRMALASAPFSYKAAAYRLGEHHKLASIDFAALPFGTRPSPEFGLRVPEAALRIREVQVEEFHEIGSHILFLTKVVRDTVPEGPSGLQLFHAFSSYRQYLAMTERGGRVT
jgi:flavin reductase (DIM6/NTAB) family NADH-FMN oxidoreductase RutF